MSEIRFSTHNIMFVCTFYIIVSEIADWNYFFDIRQLYASSAEKHKIANDNVHSKRCNLCLPYVKHAFNVRHKTYVKGMDRAPYV